MLSHNACLRVRLPALFLSAASFLLPSLTNAAEPEAFEALGREYQSQTLPLLKQFCLDCHSTAKQEGELDLERFAQLDDVRRGTKVWLKVVEMLDNGEMPPKDAKPYPTVEQKKQLRGWIERYLDAEAYASAGDPGPVVLRRLSNAEYTYTIRDLTGVPGLNPAREFPADSAAGEGFTNTGNALVMSPALLTKYFDAGKDIAQHAVLLPDGFQFSPSQTSSDWTNDRLAQIREFYRQFADASGGTKVNLQGIVFDTNSGGRLAVEKYLAVTLLERDALKAGSKTIDAAAQEHRLNAKYLGILWQTLNSQEPSLLLDEIRAQWRAAKANDAVAVSAEVHRWQQALWRFTSVGHIGKLNGPKAWQEPVQPLTARHELKVKLAAASDQKELTLYLVTSDAGDGRDTDFVVWEQPRLVTPGRPDLLLRDVRSVTQELTARRERLFASAAKSLAAAAEASASKEPLPLETLAEKHKIDADVLSAWLDYLGIGTGSAVKIDSHLTRTATNANGYDFIKGWVSDNALSLVANSSDQHVRIPGNMKPHSVAVHPAPTIQIIAGWRSPVSTTLRVDAKIQHAHPECGNGVVWILELRRGNTRQKLATGVSQGSKEIAIGPFPNVSVKPGDVITMVVGPRDGNHSCDLTAIDLTLTAGDRIWNLAHDVSSDILAGNPHADRFGNKDVWHFFSEPVTGGDAGVVIPEGSVLTKWLAASTAEEKQQLAEATQKLLQSGSPEMKDSPDAVLYRQLSSLGGPLVQAIGNGDAGGSRSSTHPTETAASNETAFGLDPVLFGKHPNGSAIDAGSLCVQAPAVIEVRLPADLANGAEFVTTGSLHRETATEGSVQIQVLPAKPDRTSGLHPTAATETNANGPWTSNNRGVAHATPVLVNEDSAARKRMEAAFAAFRNVFPVALSYTKIVPVDEVVTLTLFYREDDQLQRLMLNDEQTARLNRLWDELHFISHDALTLVDAYAQLMEYATQDADPKVFEPLRKPINDRAAAFRKTLLEAEPKHVEALIQFASLAYRRPLTNAEATELRNLYQRLRADELPHEEAFRFLLARLFVAPAFLYRLENSPVVPPAASNSAKNAGIESHPVSDWELATRLSYFLWSSTPDEELRAVAASGKLHEPDVLAAQMRRMLKDARVRRLATEFACQWLHIYEFDTLDEKSEKHFPEFKDLRGDMYEESIRFFTDAFQQDASILSFFDADHTFVNERLAKFYAIDHVSGAEWQRVDNLRRHGRGGLLAMASTLAKQSGASRTSPILRGNWVSEVLLGEKLPRPPKNVPQLPDDETATEGLTVRQLVEKHSSDPRCMNCHQRVDPFGFSLEGFDTIGRRRDKDLAGRPIDANTKLPDNTEINGLPGLRNYLLTTQRDTIVRQFCRKLLGYSLGRGVQLSDQPLLNDMQEQLKKNDHRVTVAVDMIIRSRQFRERRLSNADPEATE